MFKTKPVISPSSKPPVFVLGGRYGDHVQNFPCFLEIKKRIGLNPVVVCSDHFASVYDGVSYVKCHQVSRDWWRGVPLMYNVACELYGGGQVLTWWRMKPEEVGWVDNPGGIVLQCHGHQFAGVNVADYPDYGTSMADRAGFTREEWMRLPLVFDRRDIAREVQLYKQFNPRRLPMLLVNFSGQSSPFAPTPEVMNVILEFRNVFHIVNLGEIRAHRIYDLLGLMDRAVGLIHIDSATLHIAPASKVPHVAYIVGGWCSSVPKGNCVWSCYYSDAIANLGRLRETLKQWQRNIATVRSAPSPVAA